MRNIVIPFSGFYHSVHDAIIDDAIEGAFTTDTGEVNMPNDFYQGIDFLTVFLEYSRLYVDQFVDWLEYELGVKIDMVFDDLVSPRFYNFETDRIFCKISEWDIWKLYCRADREKLEEMIRERFTSCDGFKSHYENSLEYWPKNVLEWDHNQLGTLLECAIGGNFDDSALMLDANCNGTLDNIIFGNLTDHAKELYENFVSTQVT